MIFYKDIFKDECVEINTLSELKAYALGGTGVVRISFIEHHPFTAEHLCAVIKKVETLREDSDEITQ